jgi:hypothetical protein
MTAAEVIERLRRAQREQLAVRVVLVSGKKFHAGVHELDDDGGSVSLYYQPETFGDPNTRTFELSAIRSVEVTDFDWRPPPDET